MRGGLKRLDRITGVESVIQGMPEGAEQLRLTPDEAYIGFVPESQISPVGDIPMFSLLNIRTGVVKRTHCAMEPNFGVDGDGAVDATYAFLPSGRAIVLGRGGRIRLCELDGADSIIPISASVQVAIANRAHTTPQKVGTQLRFLTAAPSGTQLAFTARGHNWVLDIRDGSVARATQGSDPEYMPSYSPDGSQIVYVALEDDGASSLRLRTLASGVERVILSTSKVLANPTWSPDGKRLAFVESPPSVGTIDGARVELKWISIAGGERGTFAKDLYPFLNTNRYYPTLAWDRASEGIFYSVYSKNSSSRNFLHQNIGQDPVVVYDTEWSIWDTSFSPSGRYVAFMDISGISVAPAAGSNAERLKLDRDRISQLKRVTNSTVDYMTWLPDDRLAWSVQDEVFVTDAKFDKKQSINVHIPNVAAAPSDRRVAYIGANIITMTNKNVIENGALVTKGKHIEYVGPLSDAPIEGAEIVDVKGKTIIPGMIDVHHHEEPMNRDVTPELSHRLFVSAAYGVTTVLDPSFTDIDGSVLRERSSEDSYPGATLYTSGAPLLGPSGNPSYTRIDSYEDAVKFMKRKEQAGSVVVKDYLQPTRNQRRWLAQAAREAGLGITGHERNDIRTHMTMVVDGFSGLEHTLFGSGGRLYGDVQTFLVKSGISMTPTLADANEMWGGIYFYKNNPPADNSLRCLTQDYDTKLLARPRAWMVGESMQESAMFDMAKQYAQMLNDGGFVTIGAHNMPEGIGTHWEMWLLNMAGATPMNVLRAATINGAVKLELESSIGSIGIGMDADFVVLNSNPLDDIKSTTDISRVVRRGRTMSWPAQKRQPITWTAQASWDECKKWNLGLPPPAMPAFGGVVQTEVHPQ